MTPSTMMPLGTQAPDFTMTNAVDGKAVSLKDFDGSKALLVMFICNHCPFVVHVRDEFGRLEKDYQDKGLAIVAINSNSIETHATDGPEHMKQLAGEMGWQFPFLFDATQDVAKAFSAACTPDIYLFDGNKRLVYRGQLDDSRPGNDEPINGKDLRAAIELTLAGNPVPADQKPSAGCNIKWAPGNEPAYFGAQASS
jgi:peroxiredoxin